MMNICSDRCEACDRGNFCAHSEPHVSRNCGHVRFTCEKFPNKKHRCKRWRPERETTFSLMRKQSTFLVVGRPSNAVLQNLLELHGTKCKQFFPGTEQWSLPMRLFPVFERAHAKMEL